MAYKRLGLLTILAWRNLLTHKLSTAVVGIILFIGTWLLVVGGALIDSIDHSMAQSVISSLAGHLQVYSSDARDKLALFGSAFIGEEDIGEIADFAEVKAQLLTVPNVRAVVPMGIGFHILAQGNDVDLITKRLRQSVEDKDRAAIAHARAQLTSIAHALYDDVQRTLALYEDPSQVRQQLADLNRVQSPAFWNDFNRDPSNGLLFIESRMASLADDEGLIYLRNLGTDLTRFPQLFDRFEMAAGALPPPGKRGFLFSKKVYEQRLKNKVARELDTLHREITEKGKAIASDAVLADHARRLPCLYKRLVFQLSPPAVSQLEAELRRALPDEIGNINALLQRFLRVDDANFAARYDFFYQHIAPLIRLYAVSVGETVTLRSVTKSGYMKSANVRVYGIFQFKGLEESDLAGAQNLLDMETFRDLYGYMTDDKRAELAAIKQEVGVQDIDREAAEADLFGGGTANSFLATAGHNNVVDVDLNSLHAEARANDSYDPNTVDVGIAVHAAVLLQHPEQLAATQQAIADYSASHKLGLRVVDWQSAAGMTGQFIFVVRLVLYVAIFVIFLVAMVVINNAMVMSTMERVSEIGTMRAIGAQRRFVLGTLLIETLLLGTVAGSLGAGAGAGFIAWCGHVGVPAWSDVIVFFFSGPRLYPALHGLNVLLGLGIILLVSLLSTLYPARIATRIAPVVAMQPKE